MAAVSECYPGDAKINLSPINGEHMFTTESHRM